MKFTQEPSVLSPGRAPPWPGLGLPVTTAPSRLQSTLYTSKTMLAFVTACHRHARNAGCTIDSSTQESNKGEALHVH